MHTIDDCTREIAMDKINKVNQDLNQPQTANRRHALIISGKSLTILGNDAIFLKACLKIDIVVACRVTP